MKIHSEAFMKKRAQITGGTVCSLDGPVLGTHYLHNPRDLDRHLCVGVVPRQRPDSPTERAAVGDFARSPRERNGISAQCKLAAVDCTTSLLLTLETPTTVPNEWPRGQVEVLGHMVTFVDELDGAPVPYCHGKRKNVIFKSVRWFQSQADLEPYLRKYSQNSVHLVANPVDGSVTATIPVHTIRCGRL